MDFFKNYKKVWDKNFLVAKKTERASTYLMEFLQGKTVICACSAGPDSTYLAWVLSELRKKSKGFRLVLAHVNYQLRGEDSYLDEKFVKKLGKNFKLPVKTLRVSKDQSKDETKNTQAWARKKRFEFFLSLSSKFQNPVIVTGHNFDDVIETILFRKQRGYLSYFWMDPKPCSVYENIPLLRPLLSLTKREILLRLKKHNLSFRLDKSNLTPTYERNKFRLIHIPPQKKEDPKFSKKIFSEALKKAELFNIYKNHFNNFLENNRFHTRLPINSFLGFVKKYVDSKHRTPKLQAFLLGTWLEKVQKSAGEHMTYRFLRAIIEKLKAKEEENNWSALLPGGNDILYIFQEELICAKKDQIWMKYSPRFLQQRKNFKMFKPFISLENKSVIQYSHTNEKTPLKK